MKKLLLFCVFSLGMIVSIHSQTIPDYSKIKLEVKDVLIEHNVPIIEPKVIIPDEERKLEWIKKLQEAKAELN